MLLRTMGRISLFASLVLMLAASLAAQERPLALTHSDAGLQWGGCPPFMPEGCAIAVLHGDPANANADILFRVPGGSDIASHWHTSAERMVLLSGKMIVKYDGAEPVTLEKGMYAYGPAKHAHSARCEAGEPCVLFIAFEDPVDAVATE